MQAQNNNNPKPNTAIDCSSCYHFGFLYTNKMKEFKLKDLKKALDKMTKEELNQPILYVSDDLCLSGTVTGIGKAKATLYNTFEDDPAELYTMKQLKENYDKEEIESFAIEINRGDFVIKF